MKGELNGVDVHVLCGELNGLLSGARVDKAYQFGGKELMLKLYKTGAGALDLVVTPKYFCATKYSRRVPEKPSSFAMQLRKVLDGGFLAGVRQRDFDRIVEFAFDVKGIMFYIVAEFFGTGNVFLLDAGRRIMGLFEWQRWKDRTLGVGKVYEYPPAVSNPLKLSGGEFMGIRSGGKGVAAAIASSTSVGGFYAEEVCARANVDRKRGAEELSDVELDALWSAFRSVLDAIESDRSPAIVYDMGIPVDVVPIAAEKLGGMERREFESFNSAVDEYFSLKEGEDGKASAGEISVKKRGRIEAVLKQQQEALERMKADVESEQRKGDGIYARYGEIEGVVDFIRQERSKGVDDRSILEQLRVKGVVKNLDRFELTLEL